MTIPLTTAGVCVNCNKVFEISGSLCPCCGSIAWMPLDKWVQGPKEMEVIKNARIH